MIRLVLAMAVIAAAAMALPANVAHGQGSVPDRPTGLSVSSSSHDAVTLTWDDPEDDTITGYQALRRSRDGTDYGDGLGAAEFVAIVDDTGSSATRYTDASVTPRSRYVYRVKARNTEGLSDRSVYLNVETPEDPFEDSGQTCPGPGSYGRGRFGRADGGGIHDGGLLRAVRRS